MKLGEILSGPEMWGKGVSRDENGRYCLVGALIERDRLSGYTNAGCFRRSEYFRLLKVIQQLFPDAEEVTRIPGGVLTWNDNPSRTWEEMAQVVEAYDRDCLLNP